MKEIILKVPDKKYVFFMELIKELGFEIDEDPAISEKHKAIVRERIKNTVEEDMIPWQDARKKFTYKSKS